MKHQPCHSPLACPPSPLTEWVKAPRPTLAANAPTAGYLCGGGGLLSAGFLMAGIRSLWNIDCDPADPKLSAAIANLYERNFHHRVIRQPLQKVAASNSFKNLPTPDILVLTQSCKHLSRSNPKAQETQADIDTATAATVALETFTSPVFVVENVPQYQQSQSWQLLKSALLNLGYQYTAQVLNSADFGVPQNRDRFIALAVLDSPPPVLPQPTVQQPVGWYAAISDLLPHLEDIDPTPAQLQRLINLPPDLLQQPLLIERVGAWGNPKIALPDEACWTIRKSIWLDQRHNSRANAINIRLPDGTWKNLGIRGAARLMAVPDWFWLPEEAWIAGSALGNGVPTLFAHTLAHTIGSKLQPLPHETPMPDVTWELLGKGPVPDSELSLTPWNESTDDEIPFDLETQQVKGREQKENYRCPPSSPRAATEISYPTAIEPAASVDKTTPAVIRIRHLKLLECPQLETQAAQVLHFSFTQMRSSWLGLLEAGRQLLDMRQHLYAQQGQTKGDRHFKAWLASSDWGFLGRRWATAALHLASWWQTLSPHLQQWLPNHIQAWSASALARLPIAAQIGRDFLVALVSRGKQTAKSINRALKSHQLEPHRWVTVVAGDNQWTGQVGQIIDKAADGSLTLQFADGLSHTFAPEAVEAHPDLSAPTDAQPDNPSDAPPSWVSPGLRVVVLDDTNGWAGSSGVIVQHWDKNPNHWWVLLDSVQASGQPTKHLFHTHQIVSESEYQRWKAINPHLLTSEEKDRMEQQAKLYWFERFKASAREEVKAELNAARQKAQQLEAKVKELEAKLQQPQPPQDPQPTQKEQQLQQRVRDLETALSQAKQDSWQHASTVQTQKVSQLINKDLEAKYQPLLQKLERQENDIKRYRDQLLDYHQQHSQIDDLTSQLLRVAEVFGFPGSQEGESRPSNGQRLQGVEALKVAVQYLTAALNRQPQPVTWR